MKKLKANEITIPRWFDRHLHLREDPMLTKVIDATVDQKPIGAVVMPNLRYPVTNAQRAMIYSIYITMNAPFGCDFRRIMTLYLTDHISPEEVVEGFKSGAWQAAKLYMADQHGGGGTTGSAHGVRDLKGRYKVFEAMEKIGMPLLGHFEVVEEGVDEFDREIKSVERDVEPIVKTFPGLNVVFEHITDGRSADFVAESSENVFATVTAHHLVMNRNGMFYKDGARRMNPGHYCLPVAKREEHRLRVRDYVTSGHPRFGAGTDSAPHPISAKERCYGCAAGIFTAPVAVELYTTVFDEDDALHHLGPFMSENFLHIYGVGVSKEMMTVVREPLEVPEKWNGVPVFMGGQTLPWKLQG